MLLSADGFWNMDCWREARTTGRRDSSVDACRVGKCCTNTPRITALTGLVEIHRVWQNIRHEWKDQGESLACSWDPESTDLFHFISVLLFFQTACRKTFSLCSVSLNCSVSFFFSVLRHKWYSGPLSMKLSDWWYFTAFLWRGDDYDTL